MWKWTLIHEMYNIDETVMTGVGVYRRWGLGCFYSEETCCNDSSVGNSRNKKEPPFPIPGLSKAILTARRDMQLEVLLCCLQSRSSSDQLHFVTHFRIRSLTTSRKKIIEASRLHFYKP